MSSWYNFLVVFAGTVGSFSLAERCTDVYKRFTRSCWEYPKWCPPARCSRGQGRHRQSSSTEPGSRFAGLKATSSAVPAARMCTLSLNQQSRKLVRAV